MTEENEAKLVNECKIIGILDFHNLCRSTMKEQDVFFLDKDTLNKIYETLEQTYKEELINYNKNRAQEN